MLPFIRWTRWALKSAYSGKEIGGQERYCVLARIALSASSTGDCAREDELELEAGRELAGGFEMAGNTTA
jgi:hypothetical protein